MWFVFNFITPDMREAFPIIAREYLEHYKEDPVAVSDMFFGWISGLGPHVQIISPESVREQYLEEMQEVLKQYNRG